MLTTALCLWAKTEIMSLLLKPIQKCSFYQFICTRHFAEAVIRAVWCSFKRSTLISKCQVYSWHFVFIHEIVFQLYSQYFSTFFLKWIVGKTKPKTPSSSFSSFFHPWPCKLFLSSPCCHLAKDTAHPPDTSRLESSFTLQAVRLHAPWNRCSRHHEL